MAFATLFDFFVQSDKASFECGDDRLGAGVSKILAENDDLDSASGQSRTDDQRFTKSGRGFDRIGRFLASQFQPEFTWLGYQPPGQLRGNYRGKWQEIQNNSGIGSSTMDRDRVEVEPTIAGELDMRRLQLDRLARFVGFYGDTVAFFFTV